jgi:hypothetical protein
LSVHDCAGNNRFNSGRDGSGLVGLEGEGAALASATGPAPANAQVIPAITVKRFSEDNSMSVSFCREVRAAPTLRDARKLSGAAAPLLAEPHDAKQQGQRWRRTGSLALTLGMVLPDLAASS